MYIFTQVMLFSRGIQGWQMAGIAGVPLHTHGKMGAELIVSPGQCEMFR
jgi:hypothetical protein